MTDRRLAIFKTVERPGQPAATVAVNPDMVQYIYGPPGTDPGTVTIFFGENSALTVHANIDGAARLLGFAIPRNSEA